jgi:hypothetical protein
MNDSDKFEERLRRRPLLPVPATWRDEILGAARAASGPRPVSLTPSRSWFSALRSGLSALLWPHPTAWAGLAALWLLVLGLNLSAREPAQSKAARRTVSPSPQVRELLQQQERLFAELLGPVEKSAADRPKQSAPRPHSQRRENFLNA